MISCIFIIKKFHAYLLGHHLELITDHKPLCRLRENCSISAQASACIKRWSLFLSMYEYTLIFRGTKAHANADALTRLPLSVEPATIETLPELVLLTEHLNDSPVTAKGVHSWTRKDPKLARVQQFLMHGWPSHSDSELDLFTSKRLELSSYDGCILWGTRVVIPRHGREAVLQELHEGHPGMSKMKALARMYVWWQGIDSDIERSVHICTECQEVQSSSPIEPLNPWKWPTRPWSRLHLDFMGPFEDRMFLILIDAHSKWIKAFCTQKATSKVVIDALRTVFARFGIPKTIVSDNGTPFVSEEFVHFLHQNGIKHNTSAPYHPSSNGIAEHAVQIVKRSLKKVISGDINSRLAKVLLTYHNSPQSTTGVYPKLLVGMRLRTLDLLKPNTAATIEEKQLKLKCQHDARAKIKYLSWES